MNHKRGRAKNARAGCLICKPHKANGNGEKAKEREEAKEVIEEGKDLAEANIPREILAYYCDTCEHMLEYCDCEVPTYTGIYE